jgi:hypothetical protein
MKEKFADINFRSPTLAVINHANKIIAEYQAQGFRLTLRQLYYQFVARALIPNKQTEYKRLGGIIDDGRQAGLIDWDAIEDRTRNLVKTSMWRSPEDIMAAVVASYQEDPWRGQNYHVEVWIEKDALTGIIESVCNTYRVGYFACRGYVSQSEMYSAAQRLKQANRAGRRPVILHLGDHDPSGMHMTVDNGDRLRLFMRSQGIDVERLALNMDQVEEYNPPPNPAKDTDSRFAKYEAEHGDESWELDALDPPVIEKLIRDALRARIDPEPWAEAMKAERRNKRALAAVTENWTNVRKFVEVLAHPIDREVEPFETLEDVLVGMAEAEPEDDADDTLFGDDEEAEE